MQVFVPREDLSLDVIKQYQVVSGSVSSKCTLRLLPTAHRGGNSICDVHAVYSCALDLQECPTPIDKVVVLEEMIFPQCEKLGQTIIFVRTREIARTLHAAVRSPPVSGCCPCALHPLSRLPA